MNKAEFNKYLSEKLSDLPKSDIEKSLNFYSEIIDDRMEEGIGEEEAVTAIGDVDAIAKEILLDTPLANLMKSKLKPRSKMRGWEITLLILGFPIWFPLIVALFVVFIAVYIVIWSVIITLYVADLSFVVCGIAGSISSIVIFAGNTASALLILGCSLFAMGLGIFAYFAVSELTKMLVKLTGMFTRFVKSLLIKREAI